MKRSAWIWALPGFVTALAIMAVGWSEMERERIYTGIESMFADHITSVAKLIKEGVESATSSLALIYQLAERELQSCAFFSAQSLLPHPTPMQISSPCGLVVWLTGSKAAGFQGDFGPLTKNKRTSLIQQVLQVDPGEIVELDSKDQPGLYCAHYLHNQETSIACKSLAELSSLRAQTGLGTLFKQIAGGKLAVVYAAIQDQTGMLASSEGAILSTWNTDPKLEEIEQAAFDHIHFRLIEAANGGQHLMEGLSPFLLPDGTTAVLRIGIDAARLDGIQAEISQRHRLLVTITVMFVAIVWIGAWFINRWERRRKEYLQKIAAQEQIQQQWQAIGQMAATVAHEIRNPLNTLRMSAQRLEREFEIPNNEKAEFKQLLQNMQGETERIDRVVGDFMELGKPLVLKMEKTAWMERIDHLLNPLRYRAQEEKKEIFISLYGDTLVRLDSIRFDQIMSNLLVNALDALSPGGTVRIEGQASHSGLHLTIVDDGQGMDEKTREQAQKAFFTTKSKGSGLGLPLAKKLIQAHHGSLRIHSAVEKGTRIELFFPNTGNGEVQS